VLRSVHPYRRLDVQSARQVAEDDPLDPRGAGQSPPLNYLLTSHVWRQDHNGFSHQDPGFIDHVVNKKRRSSASIFRPDANTLLSVTDHCLRSRDYVNVIVAVSSRRRSGSTWTPRSSNCTGRDRIWEWASSDGAGSRMSAGLLGRCADDGNARAVDLLARAFPELRIRVVNVVDSHEAPASARHRTVCPTMTSISCSRKTSRSSSRSTAIRG